MPLTASATDPLPDGLTEATAAASCWEIKQNRPSSPNGVYWLVTPTLVHPQQFYCDQESEGGGWVLIGRGREGWKSYYQGLRPESVAATPSGIAAFQPGQLASRTIDGLLDGRRVDALADGIRVRRATDTAGSSWQEARFSFVNRDRWVWTFDAEHRVSSYRFGAATGSGGQTSNFGNNNTFNRISTQALQSHSWTAGWAFGTGVTGSNAGGTYMWTPNNGQGAPRPFTQLFIRPMLRVADLAFGTVPDAGLPATTLPALPDSNALTTVWGVSGSANGGTGELNTEVAAFGEHAGVVYVGGNFRFVQRNEAGSGQVEQSYIAGFDVTNGEWVSTFRPRLNGQVKAITALPDGRLAIGGQFSTVNGTPQRGLAFLDPTTGQLSGQQVEAENRSTGGVAYVRGLDVQGDHLYVAGAYTHLTALGSSTTASAWNGGRVSISTSTPDTNWNAFFNGTSVGVEASESGDRTYFSGYFRMKGETPAVSATALRTTAGAPLTDPQWQPLFSKSGRDAQGNVTGNVWQLGVAEIGGQVWLGGSEHSLFSYNRNTFARTSGSITKDGGDFQTVATGRGLVLAGCHCGDFVYQDAYNWDGVGTGWTQADKISLFGAWDATTNRYVYDFSPIVTARAGYGVWGVFMDSTGVVWAGGDLSRTIRAGFVNQWSGGFARFGQRDAAAPSTPGAATATLAGGGDEAQLSWGASTDAGAVTYEVLRENRVIASTTARTLTVPATTTSTRYFVRARDAVGNRSATTAAVRVETGAEPVQVANGEVWSYRFSGDPLPADWAAVGFDDSSWPSGSGLFGRGVTAAATNIDPAALSPRPLSAQFRKSFEVEDVATVGEGSVTVIANDGVVVYLNGVELGRTRMPVGTLTQNSYATGVVSHATAAANRSTFTVPVGVLQEGVNVLAASVHANYRNTPDLSFDLALLAERGDPIAAPGEVSGLTADAATPGEVALSWTAPDAGGPVASYEITRDGAPVTTVPVTESSWKDTAVEFDRTYLYRVAAVGPGGSSPAAAVSVTTPPEPEPEPEPVQIANGEVWSYRFSGDALPADWAAVGFDDSSWPSGSGLFGRGVTAAATNIDPAALSPRPLSAQFRKSFEVEDVATVGEGSVTVIANDGVVVYLNGVELGRTRMPVGTLTQNSYATGVVSHATAAANRSTFTVPVGVLQEGVNVLAASVHANYRNTPDLSFDLTLIAPR